MTKAEAWLEQSWELALDKTLALAARLGDAFPHVAEGGRYDNREEAWWTAGFYPGLLWLTNRARPDSVAARIAQRCEGRLEKILYNSEAVDHDLGFIWLLSGVAAHRLTGDSESRRRGLLAANLLAARFNVNGRFIRAWNFPSKDMDTRGVAIIDSMMNLPLLYWASEESGDPRFAALAVQHADTVAREFVRSDGSITHVVEFDPEIGKKVAEHGGQGFAPGSAWARGTAWALYGFTLSYGYTRDSRYLKVAENTAEFFLSQLGDDCLPVWDFRAEEEHRGAWDSSAAAIAASGLLELAKYSTRAGHFTEAAESILKGLHHTCTAWGEEHEGLLMNGTVHYPEQKYINVPIIYGDYFFVEALAKLRGEEGLFSVEGKKYSV
ncbi:glycoside hydrolase family 88 protein [Paenibacillus polymyxa]|uniref:glycoside hydrolase family 88 protein n=1 Tax=Paenibacillus polymyxa TaxID=1406 RepID=UPI002378CE64|nr:glycoside hydrolase family 88 protein [Paenibacillus polymyxa]WDM24046.1 glycoside hydrolase family 88 protein [Paenibacillus polymyxa]